MVPSTASTAHLDEPRVGAEAEHLAEEIGEGLLVAGAEAGDRRVVGDLVGADHPEGDVLAAAALDPARCALADRVGVGEQRQHHLRLVGGAAVAVGAVGGVERLEVELVDRLDHEPGEVVLGSQSRRSGGSSSGWSRSQVRKFWGMAPSFPGERTERPVVARGAGPRFHPSLRPPLAGHSSSSPFSPCWQPRTFSVGFVLVLAAAFSLFWDGAEIRGAGAEEEHSSPPSPGSSLEATTG